MNFFNLKPVMGNKSIFTFIFLSGLAFSTVYSQPATYEIETIQIKVFNPEKKRVKPAAAFFAIAWADVYGSPIPEMELDKLVTAYSSIADKDLMIQIFLKNLIWGEKKEKKPSWAFWLFSPEKMLPENIDNQGPVEMLFLLHRTLIAKENFNPIRGNEIFISWLQKKAPGIQALIEIRDENEFRFASKKWSVEFPEEWRAAQGLRDSLLGIWKNSYQSDYSSLRKMILTEVDPLFPNSREDESLNQQIRVSREVLEKEPVPLIKATFLDLLDREPDPFELWYLTKKIKENPDFDSRVLFYSIMKTEEYKLY